MTQPSRCSSQPHPTKILVPTIAGGNRPGRRRLTDSEWRSRSRSLTVTGPRPPGDWPLARARYRCESMSTWMDVGLVQRPRNHHKLRPGPVAAPVGHGGISARTAPFSARATAVGRRDLHAGTDVTPAAEDRQTRKNPQPGEGLGPDSGLGQGQAQVLTDQPERPRPTTNLVPGTARDIIQVPASVPS